MQHQVYDPDCAKGVTTLLACIVDKQADFNSTLSTLKSGGGRGIVHTFARQALPMVWDFAEANPFNKEIASWQSSEAEVLDNITALIECRAGFPIRGTATALSSWSDGLFDAVITDPPYYDNVSYANLSDFFYVWMKRTIGHLYPEHFATAGTPKKQEIVADASRHGGDKSIARAAYEEMMGQALAEAYRVLKPAGALVVVYAHKTTLGWSTLVEALRKAGFTITEAWPLDTEMKSRMIAMDSAALASSIFLVGRKREGSAGMGNYEDAVRPELQHIVRERVQTLWKQGITGADLIIAAIGAGLRAFTQYPRVEYANGEEVPATRFLQEVEGLVHEVLLEKILGSVGMGIAAVDSASRFYVLWRFTYKTTELNAGEAIVFTYGLDVELDNGLSSGAKSLVEKKKGKYRLRDFSERGDDAKLGLTVNPAKPAALIDVLHRVLWLIENQPRSLAKYLDEADPDRERLRVVAQTLAGAALKGAETEPAAIVTTTAKEQAALGKLLANWRTLIPDPSPLFRGKEN
jgi:putative DNA methylase